MTERHSAGSTRRHTTEPPATDGRFAVPLRGVAVDPETRCAHYDENYDRIAIRFPCCGVYYPCFRCHRELADHDAERIPRAAFEEAGVLCGGCGATLSVRAYLDCGDSCPACGVAFNPGCRRHYGRYFESG